MSTQLTALRFSRYRCFRDPQAAAIGRLNLIYGENGAGKSAFARLPQVIAASRVGGLGLNFSASVLKTSGFRDVRWRGILPEKDDPDLVLGATLENGATWQWNLRWLDSSGESCVGRVEVSFEGEVRSFEKIGSTRDSLFRATSGAEVRMTFDGLVPKAGIDTFVDLHRESLLTTLDRVAWLRATRVGPSREGIPRGFVEPIDGDGRGASSQVLQDSELRQSVSSWFQTHAGHAVDVGLMSDDMHRLVLRPVSAGHDIAFPDAGEGLQQVFPIVASLELLRRRGGLLVFEEPESHIHPRLQRALAELVVQVLEERGDASVLMETHSEVFLLAALASATKNLASAVRIYWVEMRPGGVAVVDPIELDEHARPTTTRLQEAFSTMGVMRRELNEARRAQVEELA